MNRTCPSLHGSEVLGKQLSDEIGFVPSFPEELFSTRALTANLYSRQVRGCDVCGALLHLQGL